MGLSSALLELCAAHGVDCGCKVGTGEGYPWHLLLVLAALPNLSVITTCLCGILLVSYDPALQFYEGHGCLLDLVRPQQVIMEAGWSPRHLADAKQ